MKIGISKQSLIQMHQMIIKQLVVIIIAVNHLKIFINIQLRLKYTNFSTILEISKKEIIIKVSQILIQITLTVLVAVCKKESKLQRNLNQD